MYLFSFYFYKLCLFYILAHQIQCITALNISDVKLRKRSEETLYNGKPPIPESFSQHFNPSQNTSEDAQLIKSEATKFKRVNIKDLKLVFVNLYFLNIFINNNIQVKGREHNT